VEDSKGLRVGEARIKFYVKSNGHVEDVEIETNTSNAIFGMICTESITRAELPPIPPEVATLLDDGRLEIEFSFTLYPN
jgi:TonB family protein